MFSSIRFKLTLWYIGVLTVVLSALALLTYSMLVRALAQQTDKNISEVAANVTAAVQSEAEDAERNDRSPDATVSEAVNELHSVDYSVVVTTADGRVVADTGHVPVDLKTEPASQFFTIRASRQSFRVGRSEFVTSGTPYQMLIVYSLAEQRELEETVRNIFFASVLLALLLAGLGGFFLARRTLAPIAQMSERANNISAANLHERLPVKNARDELGSLANAFNQVLDRLDAEFERQRRFMADASHELRTPIAIVRGESEVALLNDDRASGDYKESLRIVNDESKRLTKIVEDLFMLARADSDGMNAEFHELYADEVLADCVRSIRTLAESRFITVGLTSRELTVKGDEAMLRRLFINLLDNAIKYNYSGGLIEVDVSDRVVRIGNTGPEIPEEISGQIFERFFRVDKARSADRETLTSGAGLGLSIAKVIAELHHADVRYQRLGIENIFTVAFKG